MSHPVFFPQALLDLLVDGGHVDLDGEELVIADGGYRYRVEEAVFVLREVTSGDDPQQLCGKVRSRAQLGDELGAELLGSSMLVEDWAYDVVPGFLGQPAGEGDPAAPPEAEALKALQRVAE